jgi:hypothetical protein
MMPGTPKSASLESQKYLAMAEIIIGQN